MEKEVTLAHGAGGEAYRELVRDVFLPAYGSPELHELSDSALCAVGGGRVAFTTDGYVVDPLFFPGGDIGSLAVSGTVNDLAVSGATPRYISVGMIIEAGLPIETLRRIAASIAATAARANVRVVTGDTKVVERGRADGVYITTAGVGTFDGGWAAPPQKAMCGDVILASGPIACHGTAVMSAREDMGFTPPIESDARPLAGLIHTVLSAGIPVHAMRDPTRGGVAATLCEWAESAAIDILIDEPSLPVRPDVRAACSILGLDPLFIANEGVALLSVPAAEEEHTLSILRAHPDGASAVRIAEVLNGCGQLLADTECGARRRIILPAGELLPRIC